MWQHNLKLVYRNSLKDKPTFLINLIGLSTGLACALMITLWVLDEWQVDKFHEKNSQLYMAMLHHEQSDGINTSIHTQGGLLADALVADFPEVIIATEESEPIPMPVILTFDQEKTKSFGRFVAPNYFEVFSYELLSGDRNAIFEGKQSVAISDKLALKMFNRTDVVGKDVDWELLDIKNKATITAVFKEPTTNSSNQFEILLPFEIYKNLINSQWGNYNSRTYVHLHEDTDVPALNTRLTAFIKEKPGNEKEALFLKPYADHYLHGKYENGQLIGGRIAYVQLFSIIAFFILLIACINFMNLSTAKATQKLKEIGVRKAIGADRKNLIGQYLGASMFMAMLSLVVALFLVQMLLPSFNDLTGKMLTFPSSPLMLSVLLGVAIFTGLLAGSYPALYLSNFHPSSVLKGAINGSKGELWVRKVLVVFQFALSVILIVAVLVVYQQIEFIQTKNLGYNKENILTFPNEGMANTNLETFLQEIKKIPGIIEASSTGHSIVDGGGWTTGLSWEGKNPEENVQFGNLGVYYDFIETLGVEIIQGRSFSKAFGSEESNLIMNETAIKVMGLTDPIGKEIDMWGGKATIIGVVKDFNFESLHEQVTPMFFMLNTKFLSNVMARIEAGKEKETIRELEAFYKEHNPGYSLDYSFLDTQFAEQYKAEARISTLARYFAGLAIIISCLGLFGLVAFSAQRRIKEIGIRKVLGASTFNIIRLLSTDFTYMVLIAIIIALPISYVACQNWLDDFAYSIDLKPWFFIIAGVGALLIAWLTVGVQTFKAARVNPTDCLKTE